MQIRKLILETIFSLFVMLLLLPWHAFIKSRLFCENKTVAMRYWKIERDLNVCVFFSSIYRVGYTYRQGIFLRLRLLGYKDVPNTSSKFYKCWAEIMETFLKSLNNRII